MHGAARGGDLAFAFGEGELWSGSWYFISDGIFQY